MAEKVVIGNAELWHVDCREVLPLLEADACVTDPPYGIAYMHSGGSGGVRCSAGLGARETLRTATVLPKPLTR